MYFARILVAACIMAFFTVFPIVTAKNHTITVGNGQFNPNHVDNLKRGDRVVFKLTSSYVIYQSTFDDPCVRKMGGFGPINTTDGFYQLSNPEAVYFYGNSATNDECHQKGMVFAINAKNFSAFVAKATNASTSTSKTSISTSTSTLTSNLNPSHSAKSTGYYLRISLQRVAGLAVMTLLVGLLT